MTEEIDKFIQVDEEGLLKFEEQRVTDKAFGAEALANLEFTDFGSLVTSVKGTRAFVEAFDAPLVVHQIEKSEGAKFTLLMPYDYRESFRLDSAEPSLFLDEWDRFHGVSERGTPFVLSRKAQAAFFDELDEFDDDSITVNGSRYEIPDWLSENDELNHGTKFWDQIYTTETPGWELENPSPALKDVLPQLKIPRAKILVLGCGSGNDAAFLAESGHIVVGVDFSDHALAQAHEKYGNVRDLSFEKHDAFNLPEKFTSQFDVVFEHTCFCAVNPSLRNRLMKVWKKCLRPQGQILGVFFVHPKRYGPPYGGSEWELRQRFDKLGCRNLYWTRWKHSLPRRMGKELVIFAELLES